MHYRKPDLLCYRAAQLVCGAVAAFVFKRKLLRNEIKGQKGPFVVVANHQCALDFVGLIGATARPMSFVISSSFFHSLPIRGFLEKLGVIPKQQFQTTVKDMKKMKAVVEHGQPLVIYPAGLMCEDGLSTPIPPATYKFLKWLDVDVYAARISGSYFVMPKWTGGIRPGRTYLDIYRLFTKEELEKLDVEEIRARTDEALLFDAYREQERFRIPYKNNRQLSGLEHVLYQCPHCKSEFTMEVRDGATLHCRSCGYTQVSNAYGLMTKTEGDGPELRYVSDWSRLIYGELKEKIRRGEETSLSTGTKFRMIDHGKKKFVDVGAGSLSLDREVFRLRGTIRGQEIDLTVPVKNLPTLPFSPGKHLEVQCGDEIYRCVLDDGRLVMKFINMVKIFYELSRTEEACAAK